MNVDICRDERGTAHVTAADRQALYWGQGVVHATDRGLQMLLMRIMVQGRMSELLSATDETLRIDKFFRRMNWTNDAEPHRELSDTAAGEFLQAYCDGVNSVLQKRTPWELRLLGYRAQPWRIQDMIAMSRMIGYVSLQQAQADIERLFVEMVQAGVDRPRLEELFPGLLEDVDFELLRQVQLGQRLVPPEVLWHTPTLRMISSNNWVVAGDKTASGRPILCNDPHLEGNRLPNVWNEMILQVGDRYMIGGSLPGAPSVLIGRSNDVAWGATYSFTDAVDSWMERCRDGNYFREPDRWLAFRRRTETILRKRKDPVDVVFYENDHGVLDGDPHTENTYLATRWAGAGAGAKSLGLFLHMWDVRDVEQARQTLGQIETPWNFVIADRQGNIGYQMSGLLPQRQTGRHGFVPLPGWREEHDWQGFVPAESLPRALNPESGFLVTANQDLNALGSVKPINMPMGPYRAERITEVLTAASQITADDMCRLQFDLHSTQAARFMQLLRPLLPDSPQGDLLRHWDLQYTADSRGAFLFETFYQALISEVFGRESLGGEVIDYLAGHTGVFTDFYWCFDRILLAETSSWFRGRTRSTLYRDVATTSLNVKPQPWGRGRKYPLSHMLLRGKLPRICGFDRGPITATGGRATVHQGQIYRSGGRLTTFVPSYRFVTDMAEDRLLTTLLGGPSDRRFSRWYCSDLKNWLRGNYKSLGPRCGKRLRFP